MRNKSKKICLPLLLLLFLNGCSLINYKNEGIFQFKDSYVGDNSAVGNIIEQLMNKKHFKGFELKTEEEPYGVILNYVDGVEADPIRETVIYNATFLFALIQNLDWITYNFESETYTLTKKELTDWYDKDLSKIKNEEDLKTLIDENIENEMKMVQIFEK